MVFSSSVFLFLFLPLVLGINFIIKDNYRNIFLLIVSLLFYAWGGPKYALIMIISIAINYVFGLLIDITKTDKYYYLNKLMVLIGILLNCGILFYYKYFNFFIENMNYIFNTGFKIEKILLPIGISFFTFQGMSYIIDLYWGKVKVQKNIINLALYITLFPQLIAGPIVRYIDVNEEIENRTCDSYKFAQGIRRFILGLGKKVIISNTLGLVADNIFGLPYYQNSTLTAWIGIICYTFQIYYDFSGYSDMAIGLGKMLGFTFLENFNFPYISTTVTEFWRRWHISLSSWFRDYVYIPLGGNRRGNVYINLLIVFMVTGLWHGAAWNFIIWGLWHGVFLIIERILKNSKLKFKVFKPIKWVYTMLVIMIGWVLFRSPDLTYAIGYLKIMFGLQLPYNMGFTAMHYLNIMVIVTIILASIGSIPISKFIRANVGGIENQGTMSILLQDAYILVVFIISIMFVVTSTYNPFIYFRF